MIPSYLLEAFLIFAVIVVQVKIAALRPYVVPRFSSHDVIYYSGDELPRTQDVGGAEAGSVGNAGGEEAHHRTQTIKIARGGSLVSAGGRRAQSQTSILARCGGEPVGHSAESRTSACRRTALQSCCSQSFNCCGGARSERGTRLHSQRRAARLGDSPRALVDARSHNDGSQFQCKFDSSGPQRVEQPSSRRSSSWPSCNSACSQRSPRSRAERAHVENVGRSASTHGRSRTKPIQSRARWQRDPARTRWGEPRTLQFTCPNDECGCGAATGLGARTKHRAEFETKFAGILCGRTAAFRGCFARYSSFGGRKYSRPIEGGCPSTSHPVGQRLVHEQPDGKTLWCF